MKEQLCKSGPYKAVWPIVSTQPVFTSTWGAIRANSRCIDTWQLFVNESPPSTPHVDPMRCRSRGHQWCKALDNDPAWHFTRHCAMRIRITTCTQSQTVRPLVVMRPGKVVSIIQWITALRSRARRRLCFTELWARHRKFRRKSYDRKV